MLRRPGWMIQCFNTVEVPSGEKGMNCSRELRKKKEYPVPVARTHTTNTGHVSTGQPSVYSLS